MGSKAPWPGPTQKAKIGWEVGSYQEIWSDERHCKKNGDSVSDFYSANINWVK